jgi:hypothetical protein
MALRTPLASAVLCTLLLASPLATGRTPAVSEVLPFPLVSTAPAATAPGQATERLIPDPALLTRLAGLRAVTLAEVALPGGASVQLELQRVDVAADGALLAVDGVPRAHAGLDTGLTLWTGQVAGDDASDVYLAFSAAGSRGWIRQGDSLLHLVAQPDASGLWETGGSRWIGEQALRAAGATPPAPCLATGIVQPFQPALPKPVVTSPADAGPSPLLECRVALETDYQYYQLFNNLDAARTYALSLFGAINARYREQIGVIITLPYLGLYTTSNDPWNSQDSGGSSIDVLYEFRDEWGIGFGGTPPVTATVYHLMSGGDLGGGVAYLDVLCNADYGFGVTGNLGGVTPFPVVPGGALNWDFIATAHEIGHNFNAIHTHDYCPPLDQCWDNCFGSTSCTTQGTIMSYCHLCAGGFANETTFFHPQSVADMRAAALVSCMPLFEGVLSTDLGHAKAGALGVPSLKVTYDAAINTLALAVSQAPASKPGLLFVSLTQALLPFKGGTMVPLPELSFGLTSSPLGAANLPLAVPFTFPDGVGLYMQAWFSNTGGGFAATNGVLAELFIP